jgi:hypothetical protein
VIFPAPVTVLGDHIRALCIGIGDYSSAELSFQAPKRGARLIARMLARGGASTVDTLISSEDEPPITRHRVLDAVKNLERACEHDSSSVAIIYYSGHGFSDSVSHNQFWIPGQEERSHVGEEFKGEVLELAFKDIMLYDITESFERHSIRMLVISDSCGSLRNVPKVAKDPFHFGGGHPLTDEDLFRLRRSPQRWTRALAGDPDA